MIQIWNHLISELGSCPIRVHQQLFLGNHLFHSVLMWADSDAPLWAIGPYAATVASASRSFRAASTAQGREKKEEQ
ncbi:hypothetical protein DMP11_03585 [Parvibacter caecicola]|nr:hypothetical protein DMP11_03585 [Parvibacter caecicola]